MHCYYHTDTDPAFNLATEEILLKTGREDCFMVWRNDNAIVVGKNQNALAQINPEVVDRHGIRVVRRISGGGSVYHDLGNVNFTFIQSTDGTLTIDYAPYTRPIIAFLKTLGVPADFDRHHGLTIEGLKLSGNSQHVHQGRVLHHGTLLFDTDLGMLARALRRDPTGYRDKSVQSIHSRVTNIRPHLPIDMSVDDFMASLMEYIRQAAGGRVASLSAADRSSIVDLAETKYRRWWWNFGTSPDYDLCRTARTEFGLIDLSMQVREGVIRSLRLSGDGLGTGDPAELEGSLIGCRHHWDALGKRLDTGARQAPWKKIPVDKILDILF